MFVDPAQTEAEPDIAPGVAGVVITETGSVAAAEEPQALLAVTETVPPLAPAVVLMLFVVLVPDHVPGRVQV